MTDTSGFYKNDGGNLLYARNSVTGPTFQLLRAQGASAPITQGWQWFDTEDAACTAYGLPVERKVIL